MSGNENRLINQRLLAVINDCNIEPIAKILFINIAVMQGENTEDGFIIDEYELLSYSAEVSNENINRLLNQLKKQGLIQYEKWEEELVITGKKVANYFIKVLEWENG